MKGDKRNDVDEKAAAKAKAAQIEEYNILTLERWYSPGYGCRAAMA